MSVSLALGQGIRRSTHVIDKSGYHERQGFESLGMETPARDIEALCAIVKQLREVNRVPNVVEIGTWAGRTAIEMADAGANVYCVDHWQGSIGDDKDVTAELVRQAGGSSRVFATFLKNVGGRLFRSIFPCIGSSELWGNHWPWLADMVFIDGDHRYESVRADIALWKQHVRPGGVLAGHDYTLFEGVRRAVDELVPERQLAGACIWWWQRPF